MDRVKEKGRAQEKVIDREKERVRVSGGERENACDKSDHGRAFVGRHSRLRKLLGAAEPITRAPTPLPPLTARFPGSKAFIKRPGGGGREQTPPLAVTTSNAPSCPNTK